MPDTLSTPLNARRVTVRHGLVGSNGPNIQPPRGRHRARRTRPQYARFIDGRGRLRELISEPGADGTVLVVDRNVATHDDRRLLAHLAADEPVENALLICRHYLRDPRSHGRCCRYLTDEDLSAAPPTGPQAPEADSPPPQLLDSQIADLRGASYALRRVDGGRSVPQLRWCRRTATEADARVAPLCLREVIGCLESYEPVLG